MHTDVSTTGAVVDRLRAAGCVFAEEEAALLLAEAVDARDLDARVARRAAGEPLEHVLGWAVLCGVRVVVDRGVFVPRRRSELLAECAVELAAERTAVRTVARGAPVVVDLCCGTGALGLVVATRVPGVVLHAADVEPAAVACARRNLAPVGGLVHEGDLDAPLPAELRHRVQVLVANVPYVPTRAMVTMPAEARLHEPRVALDGGPDGLDVLRRLAAAAPRWLAPGGAVLVESTQAQLPAVLEAFSRNGLTTSARSDDDLGATVVSGVLEPVS
jgi:release factor glutamine methyltransferase